MTGCAFPACGCTRECLNRLGQLEAAEHHHDWSCCDEQDAPPTPEPER